MKVVRRTEPPLLLVQSLAVTGTEGVVGGTEPTLPTGPDRLTVPPAKEEGNERNEQEKQNRIEIPPGEDADGETHE